MEIDLYEILKDNQVLIIFAVISLGYVLGKINIFGFELGSVTGVLIAGLLLGAWGFTGNADMATFGFTIFIFCVGLQAGPSFFSAFAADGARYFALAMIVAIVAVGMCVVFAYSFDMASGLSAGMLAGALTSTPTLVGAQDSVNSGLAVMSESISPQDAIQNISVAYSLTYLFGVGGLMFIIKYIPVIFKIDLPAEAKKIAPEQASVKSINEDNLPMVRTYEVEKESLVGKTVRQIQNENEQFFTVLGIRRGSDLIDVDRDIPLEKGDVVSVIASVMQHNHAKTKEIKEVFDKELLNFRIRTKEIVVTNPEFTNRTVRELKLSEKHGCYPLGIIRSGVDLPVTQDTIIHKGDKLEVIGEDDHITELSEKLGSLETDIEKTDLLTLCMGTVFGLIIGTIVIKFGDISVGLGSAGGLLIVGILIGFFRSVHPTFGAFPRAARNIMMDLGIVLFMSSVGLNAGAKVVEALLSVGPILMICGVALTAVPVFVAFMIGRYVMNMNPALLLGAITGSMTSTPSLNMITEISKSQVPALGYAGSYTFANVILTFAGALLMML